MINGIVSVTNGATLTIQPGVIVKFGTGTTQLLLSGGKLNAAGSSGSPIIFTSLADDSVAGDTGGDGPTSGSAGQWCDLAFTNSATFVGQSSTLSYVTIRYAGKGTCGPAAISMTTTTGNAGPNVTVSNSTVTNNNTIGIYDTGSTLILQTSSVDHSGSDGIKVTGTNGYATINGSSITANGGKGLSVWSLASGTPPTAVFDSTLTGNAIGVYTLLSTSLPAASWPFGHRDNIYGNGGATPDQAQLFDTNASPRGNWTNNYWGSDVVFTYNYSECGPPIGYLTYSSNTYPNQAGPVIHGSQWSIFHPLPQGSTHCFKDKTFVGAGEFSPVPFSSSPSVAFPELLGMGSSVYANVGQEVIGEPVNPVTGNFSRAETDLSFPEAVGVPFTWTRNYNGFQDLSSPLGPGWTGSWSDSLELLANGDINFRSANGGRFHYTLQSGGSYLGDAGVTATLATISGGYEVTRRDQVKLDFDSSGKLTSLKDRNGQGLAFSYTSGRLSTVTDSAGRTMSFSYNGGGRLTQVSSSDGRSVSYSYNTAGQLATDTDTRGKLWSYSYDTNGLLTKETDPRSRQVFKLVYDNYGRVTDRYDAFNNDTTFSYNFSTQTTTITDPLGKVIKDIYQNGLLVERIDQLNQATYRSYDSNLSVASTTDARGKVTTYNYDSAGDMLTKTAPAPLSYVQTWTYNSKNDITSYVDGRSKTTTFGYDSAGNLTSITRPGSNVTSFAYDSGGKGLLVSTTDPRSKTTSFAYDSSNNRTSATDPDGNVTIYGYDSIGRVTSVVDPRGNASGANPNDYKTTFSYDAAGHLLTKTDPLGNVTNYTYDDTGNQATFKNAFNKTWTYAYDDANELTSITAPDASTVTKTYTVRGELASVTDQLGQTTSYTYDDAGQLASKVMPRGNVSGATPSDYTWTYGDDANGNQTSVTDPLGHATTYAHDALNRLISVTDPLSQTTSFDYDANSNQTSKTDPLSHTVSSAYDDLNRLISMTDGRGKTTTYGYDAAGNRTSVTDPLGNQATYSYDDAGRMIASIDARGNASGANPNDYKTTYGYDEAGNQTTRTDPLGQVTAFVYDRDGRLLSKTDPLSHSISYGYDAVGRLQSVTAPDTSTTSYGYDDVGNLTGRTDANLHTTAYGYDAAQRLTSITNPLGKLWTFVYDADDELTSRVDAIANAASNPSLGTTTYAFDRAGRQTGVDYSDSTPDVTYGYDNANRLTSMTDGAGTKSYGYDNANRLTSIGRGAASFTYSYDNANNLTQTTHPDSTSIAYGYDNAERLSSMAQGSNTTSYGYDEAGELTSKTLANGIIEARSYDRAGQLSEIAAASGSTPVTDFQVTRDAAGYPTQVSKLGGAVETYGYDSFGRLTSVCFQSSCPNSSDPKISWTYDSIGRRLTETRPSGTLTYSYNAGDQITSTTNGSTSTSYSYDADGRETGKGSSSFGYDMASDLTSATVGSTTSTYTYEGQGNRLSASDGSSTTNDLWDENTLNGLPQLARESDGSGNLIRRYLSDADGPSTLQTGSGSFYYLRDQAGSIAQLTDASANTEWSYTYEPFGATKTATKVDPSAPDDPVQFDGQYLDSGSGLYDLRARQYDANDGRFLSTDPLAPARSDPYVSAYAYAGNQPTLLADPSGMSAGSWAGTIMWRATTEAFDGVARLVRGPGHLMSIGIHICEMATPWGVLKYLCAPILVTVAFAALSPEFLFASESEGLLGGLFSREAYAESRSISEWVRGLGTRLWSEERGSLGGQLAAEAGTSLVRYDADFALGQLTRSGSAKASELVDFAESQGWTRAQTAAGPIKYVDENGVTRLTIKSGSPRAPGSNFPHVEMRNAAGQRIDPYGNAVTRRSPGNHTPIQWDLP